MICLCVHYELVSSWLSESVHCRCLGNPISKSWDDRSWPDLAPRFKCVSPAELVSCARRPKSYQWMPVRSWTQLAIQAKQVLPFVFVSPTWVRSYILYILETAVYLRGCLFRRKTSLVNAEEANKMKLSKASKWKSKSKSESASIDQSLASPIILLSVSLWKRWWRRQ